MHLNEGLHIPLGVRGEEFSAVVGNKLGRFLFVDWDTAEKSRLTLLGFWRRCLILFSIRFITSGYLRAVVTHLSGEGHGVI